MSKLDDEISYGVTTGKAIVGGGRNIQQISKLEYNTKAKVDHVYVTALGNIMYTADGFIQYDGFGIFDEKDESEDWLDVLAKRREHEEEYEQICRCPTRQLTVIGHDDNCMWLRAKREKEKKDEIIR